MDFDIRDGVLEKYIGIDPDVIIPDKVSCIGDSAFRGRKDIKRVVIPQSVSTIEDWAFAECESLEKVQIMGKATLEKGVFYRCTALKELIAPHGIKGIGNCSFMGCKSLKNNILNDAKFELWTLIGVHDWEENVYPNEKNIFKQTYTWNEYQMITAEILPYALINSTESYNELEGPEIPTIGERNAPITDDIILVYDRHFWGCLLKDEHILFSPRESLISRVILRPNYSSVRVFTMTANHMPFFAYEYENAVFRRYDDKESWIGSLFACREFVVNED